MYLCANCAGRLKYDINEKKLICEFCGSKFDIGDIEESKHFKKDDESTKDLYILPDEPDKEYYSSYVYNCPQCAGEIRADINEAAAFCPYCGASNVLEGQLSNEKKPDYILPFSIDKDKCKDIYKNFIKKKWFAPSGLQKEGTVDGFRGIYMPFWLYNIEQKGKIHIPGKKTRYSMNYTYYDEYDLTGDLDARYEGIMYDASSTFYDDYSQCISPFDMKEAVPFDSSYMAGFYADTYDVADEVYVSKAEEIAGKITYEDYVSKAFTKIRPDFVAEPEKVLNTNSFDKKSAMLPVWFMAYKYKGRMLYSAINGQTGEIASDVPISIKKYIIGSLLLAIPLFPILNLFLSLSGMTIAVLSALISVAVSLSYYGMSNKLRKIETKETDKGYAFAHPEQFEDKTPSEFDEIKKEFKKEAKNKKNIIVVMVLVVFFGVQLIPILFIGGGLFFSTFGTGALLFLFGAFLLSLSIVALILNLLKKNKNVRSHPLGYLMPFASGMIASLTVAVRPVDDVWYYISSVISLIGIIVAVASLVNRYNELISRPMPQFKREGGDDNA